MFIIFIFFYLQDPIFDGCDSTKACFGLPSGCVAERRCELILAYYLSTRHKEDYEFEMKGRAEVRTVEPKIFLRDDLMLNIFVGLHRHGLVSRRDDG